MASPGAGKSVIHYKSSDGGSWGAFLQKKLSEPQYAIPTELHEIDSLWPLTTKYDVNIALVSPDFLLVDSFEKFEKCRTGHSLAILLGTSKEEFYGSVSKRNPESRLLKWMSYCPEQTRDSVKGLLLTIIHLYENLHGGAEVDDDDDEICEEDPLFQLVPESSSEDRASSEMEDNYDRLPPTRQVNALNEVIQLSSSEDETRELLILLDRKTDSELELSLESGETISTKEIDQAVYKVKIPKNLIHDGGIKFTAVSNDQTLGSMEYMFDNPSRSDPKITETPHGRQRSPSAITKIQQTTSTPVSRSASRLDTIRDILEKETDPVYVLCQALRIPETDHDQLDEYLAAKCRRLRITDHFTDLPTKNESDTDSEWPTLLHFCADINLVKSTNELLQVPCLLSACLRCNKNKETPKDIAKRNGFIEIVRLLEDQQSTMLTKDPIMTSLREKNGVTDPRNVDSGVSGLHHSAYGGRDSDYMDMSRLSKPPRSIPRSARSSSVSDLRPSGDYGNVVDHPAPRNFMSMSYQEPRTYDSIPDPLSEEGFKEGGSTFFVKSPPQYKFPSGRRASESDKDLVCSKLSGQKKNSFSKTISKMFKLKRNNSTISNPESSIPEENHSGKEQNLSHARGSGFPCTPIESADNDFGDDDTFVSPKPTQIAGNRTSQKDTTLIQRSDEPPEPTKKTFKMMKNPFKKKVDRRKSLRMSRVIKDNDVTVLALPSKAGLNV